MTPLQERVLSCLDTRWSTLTKVRNRVSDAERAVGKKVYTSEAAIRDNLDRMAAAPEFPVERLKAGPRRVVWKRTS